MSKTLLKIIIGISVFSLPMLIFFKTLCPTVFGGDSSELVCSSFLLGIPHQTGYPLYTLIGKVLLLLIPKANPAFLINLLSSLCSSLTALFLFLFIMKYTRNLVSSFSGALIFVFSYTFWSQSVIAEVYTFHSTIMAAILFLIMKFIESRKMQFLILAFYMIGIGFAHHLTILLMIPGVLFLLKKNQKKVSIKCFFFLLVPISLYLYLPIRSNFNPLMDYCNPEKVGSFFTLISGGNSRGRIGVFEIFNVSRLFTWFLKYLPGEVPPFLIILFLIPGLYYLYSKQKILFGFLLILFGANFCFSLSYGIPDIEAYFIPCIMVICIILSFGMFQLIVWAENRKPGYLIQIPLKIILFISFVYPLHRHYFQNDRSRYYFVDDFAYNVFMSVEKNSILFLPTEIYTGIFSYFRFVLGQRQDLLLVDMSGRVMQNEFGFTGDKSQRQAIRNKLIKDWVVNNIKRSIYTFSDNMEPVNGCTLVPIGFVYKLSNTPIPRETVHEIWSKFRIRSIFENDVFKKNDGLSNLMESLEDNYKRLVTSFIDISYSYLSKGKYEEAKKQLDMVSAIAPESDAVCQGLGTYYMIKNDFDKAISEFQIVLNHDPSNVTALVAFGDIYDFQQNAEKALFFYKKAEALNKYDSQILMRIGFLYSRKLKDYENARKYLLKALQTDKVSLNQKEQIKKELDRL